MLSGSDLERWLSWSKAHDWKSCIPRTGYRGFESLSLRHFEAALLNWSKAVFHIYFTKISQIFLVDLYQE